MYNAIQRLRTRHDKEDLNNIADQSGLSCSTGSIGSGPHLQLAVAWCICTCHTDEIESRNIGWGRKFKRTIFLGLSFSWSMYCFCFDEGLPNPNIYWIYLVFFSVVFFLTSIILDLIILITYQALLAQV